MLKIGIGNQQRLGIRIHRVAELLNGSQPSGAVRAGKLQTGQRNVQLRFHALIGFNRQPLLQQPRHFRRRLPL